MPSNKPVGSPLIRGLIRTLLTVACVNAVLSASTVSGATAQRVAPPYRRHSCPQNTPRRYPCPYLTHLELDFLNDDVTVPEAFNVNAGEIRVGQSAEFRVYAVADENNQYYEDVTTCVRELSFRKRGFRDLSRLRYRDDGGNPRWVYEPRRPWRRGHTGTIDCSFACQAPSVTYTTRFVLTVIGYESPLAEMRE